MVFTKEQAELNGQAVAAHLQGKPIEIYESYTCKWLRTSALDGVEHYCFRPKTDPAPPQRWSRMEHVPLPCWLRRKFDTSIIAISSIHTHRIETETEVLGWDELSEYLHTTGERDASGSFIFRECLVLP